MRPRALLFLLLTLFAVSISAYSQTAPLTCGEVLAWTAGGMSSQRLGRLAQASGVAFPLDAAASVALSGAGVQPALLRSLHAVATQTRAADSGCPSSLVRVSQLMRLKKYPEARSNIADDDRSRSR